MEFSFLFRVATPNAPKVCFVTNSLLPLGRLAPTRFRGGRVQPELKHRSPANGATWRLSRPRSPPRECAASDLALDTSTSCVAASYRHRSMRHPDRLRSKQDHWERERRCGRPARVRDERGRAPAGCRQSARVCAHTDARRLRCRHLPPAWHEFVPPLTAKCSSKL